MSKAKIILFGGSFDPIHNGHLRVARVVLEKLCADQLILVPARRSPHKKELPVSGCHRLEMIRRVIADSERFSVSDCELNRCDPSYTLDTIHFFRNQYAPEDDLFWLIGADQLREFDKWYKVSELLDICRICVMYRAGYPKPNFERFQGIFSPVHITRLERDVVETPLIDISSTEIRRKLANGIMPYDDIPEPVSRYIQENHLYDYIS